MKERKERMKDERMTIIYHKLNSRKEACFASALCVSGSEWNGIGGSCPRCKDIHYWTLLYCIDRHPSSSNTRLTRPSPWLSK